MNPFARVCGFGLLESLAARLPAPVALVLQLALVALGSLIPLLAVLSGTVGLPELLVYLVAAMVISIASTLIRLGTMVNRSSTTRFLMLHYSLMIGILSLVCGIWAVILMNVAGPTGGWGALLPGLIALALAAGWSLADGWFVRGGRAGARAWQIVLPGYLRFIPLLLGTVLGSISIMNDTPGREVRLIAVGLIAVQCVIDLALVLAGYLSSRRWRAD